MCQDFAHLADQLPAGAGPTGPLRQRVPADLPPAGHARLDGADASHAWISVWAPEAGWVDFDPTNDLIPSDQHITLAIGRDFDDVSPVSGVLLGGSRQRMDVAVDVAVVA